MTEFEMRESLDKIKEGARLIDGVVFSDSDGSARLTAKQAEMVRELFRLFRALDWQLKFNKYKELKYAGTQPLRKSGCGDYVRVRSCKPEHGDRTYLGILLGELALSIQHRIENDIVIAEHSIYNPAIYVPALKEVIYGCSCWWERIDDPSEADKMISDDVIAGVWYVKGLAALGRGGDQGGEGGAGSV